MNKEQFDEFVPNVDFMLIPCNQLTSDVAYQRECSERFVKKVSSNFDKNMLKVVRVSDRDGKYWVWDGQHSIEIVKSVSGNDDTPIWCMVYHGLTYEQEASLFSKQQQYEKSLMAVNITNAKLEAKDPDTVMINHILNANGYAFGYKINDYTIKATDSVEYIYREFGEECLSRCLSLIADTWKGRCEYVRGPLLKAVAKLCYIYGDELDDDAFVKRLSGVTKNEIRIEVNSISPIGKVNYLRALVNLYNKKGGKKLSVSKLAV